MRQTRALALALLASLLFFSAASQTARAQGVERARTDAATQRNAPQIVFNVSMPQPHTHLLEVEVRLRWENSSGAPPSGVDLLMPVWTPGSYLIREYQRHVQDFAAQDGGGRSLAWRKTNKNTWRVETGGARDVRATYRVYANELTVRTNELNDRHAFWNNAALLMYPDGHLNAPSTVRVAPFKDWKVATGLPAVAGERNTFRAENFDILYDSPFLASDFRTLTFEVRGVPHRIILDGEGNFDAERIRRDTQKIVEAAVEMMRDIPYRDYTFLFMTHPTARGGLEHLNSTAIIYTRFGFRPDSSYRDFLTLTAHEYFHLWNVKRIRPDALGPFDYTRENYTRLLWVAEGVTSYYENLLARRAGLMTDRQYLDAAARSFQDLQNTPGRLEMSVEEASFDAWIKYYRSDENTINSSISYYDKGAIIALLLDLEIRKRSKGARTLDDVMRYLYDDFYKKNRNFTPEDFQRTAERAAGSALDDFFRRYVRGRDELDYDAALEVVGLRLDTAGPADTSGAGRVNSALTSLGATLAQDGDRLVVRNVPAGSPAYEQGLNANDQIVAIDGYRATRDFLGNRLQEKRPGETVTLTVFRLDELRTFQLKLGPPREGAFRIVLVRQPTPEQLKNYQAWLGAPFPKAS
jgi:predicted metalloprotease with PDZ domain